MHKEKAMNRSNHSRYVVKSRLHASQILSALQSKGEVLHLRDVVSRTGFTKDMCFRLLYTRVSAPLCGLHWEVKQIHADYCSEKRLDVGRFLQLL